MKLHLNIKLLSWFNFLLDFRFYAPVAIIYFSQVTGSYVLGMAVFSVTFISSALFEVPTGIYSDMIGRKKNLCLGSIRKCHFSHLLCSGKLLSYFSPLRPPGGYSPLLLQRQQRSLLTRHPQRNQPRK